MHCFHRIQNFSNIPKHGRYSVNPRQYMKLDIISEGLHTFLKHFQWMHSIFCTVCILNAVQFNPCWEPDWCVRPVLDFLSKRQQCILPECKILVYPCILLSTINVECFYWISSHFLLVRSSLSQQHPDPFVMFGFTGHPLSSDSSAISLLWTPSQLDTAPGMHRATVLTQMCPTNGPYDC